MYLASLSVVKSSRCRCGILQRRGGRWNLRRGIAGKCSEGTCNQGLGSGVGKSGGRVGEYGRRRGGGSGPRRTKATGSAAWADRRALRTAGEIRGCCAWLLAASAWRPKFTERSQFPVGWRRWWSRGFLTRGFPGGGGRHQRRPGRKAAAKITERTHFLLATSIKQSTLSLRHEPTGVGFVDRGWSLERRPAEDLWPGFGAAERNYRTNPFLPPTSTKQTRCELGNEPVQGPPAAQGGERGRAPNLALPFIASGEGGLRNCSR